MERTTRKVAVGILVAVIFFGLALTNPSKADYVAWISGVLDRSTAHPPTADEAAARLLFPQMVDRVSTVSSYGLFSIFSTVTGPPGEQYQIEAVGVCRMFFYLKKEGPR